MACRTWRARSSRTLRAIPAPSCSCGGPRRKWQRRQRRWRQGGRCQVSSVAHITRWNVAQACYLHFVLARRSSCRNYLADCPPPGLLRRRRQQPAASRPSRSGSSFPSVHRYGKGPCCVFLASLAGQPRIANAFCGGQAHVRANGRCCTTTPLCCIPPRFGGAGERAAAHPPPEAGPLGALHGGHVHRGGAVGWVRWRASWHDARVSALWGAHSGDEAWLPPQSSATA